METYLTVPIPAPLVQANNLPHQDDSTGSSSGVNVLSSVAMLLTELTGSPIDGLSSHVTPCTHTIPHGFTQSISRC